jgi:hypothetical protein
LWQTGAWATIEAMAATLQLTLFPRAETPRIAGLLLDERGQEHGFSSWLDLLSLLEGARARTAGRPPDRESPITVVVEEERAD